MKPSPSVHQDENDVDSEEKEQGTEIEVNEEALPSRAAAIHEEIGFQGVRMAKRS